MIEILKLIAMSAFFMYAFTTAVVAEESADTENKSAVNERLDKKGERIDRRLDNRGERIDERLDKRGERKEERREKLFGKD